MGDEDLRPLKDRELRYGFGKDEVVRRRRNRRKVGAAPDLDQHLAV